MGHILHPEFRFAQGAATECATAFSVYVELSMFKMLALLADSLKILKTNNHGTKMEGDCEGESNPGFVIIHIKHKSESNLQRPQPPLSSDAVYAASFFSW